MQENGKYAKKLIPGGKYLPRTLQNKAKSTIVGLGAKKCTFQENHGNFTFLPKKLKFHEISTFLLKK